jgi:hypothetical protein
MPSSTLRPPVSRGLMTPEHLAAALEDERTLLTDLLDVLRRQREAVASDDLGTINDTVFATHRLLGTYREAYTRCRRVSAVVCGNEDVSLGALDDELGSRMTDRIRSARAGLRNAADALKSDLALNRLLLQRVTASGDSVLRAVARTAAGPAAHTTVYAGAAVAQADGGTFLDLRA